MKINLNKKNKAKDVIFVITTIVFLIAIFLIKMSIDNIKCNEISELSSRKWVVNDKSREKIGNMELTVQEDGTFEMYEADTQLSCMTGTCKVVFKGLLYIEFDKRGFKPPKNWNLKLKDILKYKIKNEKLSLIYDNLEVEFDVFGKEKKDYNSGKLDDTYYLNIEEKVLVYFYSGNMFMFKVDNVNEVFGTSNQVLGDKCLYGEYMQNTNDETILVNVENDIDIGENLLWPQINSVDEYEFKYKMEDSEKKIILEYEGKSYAFDKIK